jgi:hypothetical protein
MPTAVTAVTAVRRSRPLVAVLIASAAMAVGASHPGGANAAEGAGATAGSRAAVVPAPAPVGPNAGNANGFIMSDGRICDPIRHMGC